MELDVKIKEEPICFEETTNTLCDSVKFTFEEMDLKEEPKSELEEPRESQPSADIKDKKCVGGRLEITTFGQLVTSFKEGDKVENVGVLTGGSVGMLYSDPRPNHPITPLTLCCNDCGYNFSRKSHLQVHMLKHTGERPFSCDVCGKKFRLKDDLRRHARIHTGERPYSCKQCGYKFSQNVHLQTHLLTHSAERPYSCNVCDRKFLTRSNLKAHIPSHTGERPHYCEQCGKKFSHQRKVQ